MYISSGEMHTNSRKNLQKHLRREYFVALFQEVVPHEFEDVDFIVDKQDAVAHGSG